MIKKLGDTLCIHVSSESEDIALFIRSQGRAKMIILLDPKEQLALAQFLGERITNWKQKCAG